MPKGELEMHLKECPNITQKCPLAPFGCSVQSALSQSELGTHIKENDVEHFKIFADHIQNITHKYDKLLAKRSAVGGMDQGYGTMVDTEALPVNTFDFKSRVESDSMQVEVPYSMPQKTKVRAVVENPHSIDQSQDISRMVRNEIETLRRKIFATFTEKFESKDEEIASLRTQVTKLEKQIRSKNAELEDRDFRLSLIENSNHDGSMIWKIPQFSQRKADAENGKYTSIFSLPFYTGRYGFKMCLRLYIMGDGIGKGTHLSLFFVVMRGEFDNILQWPFTHKVTFKLINQAGGRDIVDTFQPDPMSSSFRKPKSDMNIASGCPRFVSHTELERGGFVVDDTIFIKCMIDTSTIRHP